MREKTCCFSGHRLIPYDEYQIIKEKTYYAICNLIEHGVCYFGSGGAIGFDTLAAEAVLEAKRCFPHIKLIMVYPCKTQTLFWKNEDIEKYNKIMKLCDKYVYVSEEYSKDCMFKRNRHLVNHSQYCICYLTQSKGGTVQTVDYAYRQGLTVINIAKQNIQI